MRIRTQNKYLSRLLAKIFNIDGYRVEFVFIKELYDPEVSDFAFHNKSLIEFDHMVGEFREQLVEHLNNAPRV